jgi:hypothetical protein
LQFFYDSLPQPFLLDSLPPHTLPAKLLVIIVCQIYTLQANKDKRERYRYTVLNEFWRRNALQVNILEFSFFADILVWSFKTKSRVRFSVKSASRRDCEKHGAKALSLLSNSCPKIPSQDPYC